jgi:cytochrome c oxidase cbb3-type subunit 2
MFSHAWIERNAIILLVLTLITVSIGGLVEIVPLYMIESVAIAGYYYEG